MDKTEKKQKLDSILADGQKLKKITLTRQMTENRSKQMNKNG